MLLDPTAAPTSDATFDYLSYEICFPFSSVFYISINFIKGLFVKHMIFNLFNPHASQLQRQAEFTLNFIK